MTPQQQADLLLARGGKALEIKRFQEAERSAREALAFVPGHHEAFVLMARALIGQGRYEPAIEATERATSTDPTDPYAHYLRGMCLELLARYTEAEPHLRKAVELEPNDGVYLGRLAMALAALKRADDARATIELALARGGKHWLVLDLCFLALMRIEDTPRAIELGERLRELRPDTAEPHRRLAWAYNLARRHEEAAVSARKAIGIAPNDPDAWFELGYALALAKSHDEALHAYRESARIRPKQPVVYENIAKLLRERGDFAAAEVELVKGLAQSPGNQALASLLERTRAALAEQRRAAVEAAERDERAKAEHAAAAERERLDRDRRAREEKANSARADEAVSAEVAAALRRAEALRLEEDARRAEARARKESARSEAVARGELPPALAEARRKEQEAALEARKDRAIGLWFFLALALVAAVLYVRGC
jgi:Flp pilus assembly protein TadD